MYKTDTEGQSSTKDKVTNR